MIAKGCILGSGRLGAGLLCTALLLQCGEGSDPADPPEQSGPALSVQELALQRDLAEAFFSESRWDQAKGALLKVTLSKRAIAEDFVGLACIELFQKQSNVAGAQQAIEQALKLDAKLASALYMKGLIAQRDLRFEDSVQLFAKALESAPDDVALRVQYAAALRETEKPQEAIAEFEKVVARGIDFAGAYYITALYQLSQLLIRSGDATRIAKGRELLDQFKVVKESGVAEPTAQDLERGNLGKVKKATPTVAEAGPGTAGAVTFSVFQSGLLSNAGGIYDVVAADHDGDQLTDLIAATENGVFLLKHEANHPFSEQTIDPGVFERVQSVSLENKRVDGSRERALSLFLFGNGVRPKLVVPGGQDQAAVFPEDLAPVDACWVDHDHDGDVDLLCATVQGLRLLRNDGRPEAADRTPTGPFKFTEVSAAAGMPSGAFRWVRIEDFDADADIDFIAGGGGQAPVVLSSLRQGRFETLTAQVLGLPHQLERAPLLADLNHDGKVDLLSCGSAPRLFLNRGDGQFNAGPEKPALAAILGDGRAVLEDLDYDFELDGVGTAAGGTISIRFGPLALETNPAQDLAMRPVAARAPLFVNLDTDADLDLVAHGPNGLDLYRNETKGNAFSLRLSGRKDNLHAVGAICEFRAGTRYLRLMYTGRSLVSGSRERERPELVRVTWPNGVVQYAIHPTSSNIAMEQKEGQVGSCPFLYTWNGEHYEFVSDVLGTTPLGLPMVEGQFVPPDHDELVRIESRQLQPSNGEYRLQITEELREVTYLDRARLWVIDHPAAVEVHPEERFTFPPFPPQRIHALREIHPVVSVDDGAGRDWTKALRAIDRNYAVPFTAHRNQFQGLATPHFLEIQLPEAARTAARVLLLMTGWLFWSDASVNVAAGHHPTMEFIPPMLQVPDANGEFQHATVLGFPAGKTKTMVVDATEWVRREDLRLRVFSTLELYWDCIRVATDAKDADYQVTHLKPSSAELYYRGFSQPIDEGLAQPERFEFELLKSSAPWDQHAGKLTRMGDVLPLLSSIDDQFAIFSSGDAIDLRFPAATAAPVAKGMARTYLLDLDGWAKDRDPNTVLAQTVEPLPFHGMSGYPYCPDEHYPDTPAHRDYQAQWNTRPGRKLVETLVPGTAANE